MHNNLLRNRPSALRRRLAGAAAAAGLALVALTPAVASAEVSDVPTATTPTQMSVVAPADTDATSQEVVDPTTVSAGKLEELGLSQEQIDQASTGDAQADAQAIADAVDEQPTTTASVDDADQVHVQYTFALKRLAVLSGSDSVDTEGSTGAVFDPLTGYCVLTYATEEDAAAAYDRLVAQYGEDNVIVDAPAQVEGSDDYSAWGVWPQNTNLAKAKEQIKSDSTVTVAVLDTGCRTSHRAFSGVTFSSDSCTIMGSSLRASATPSVGQFADDNYHGTLVSSILASGVPSNVHLLEIKAANQKGSATFFDLLWGLKYAQQHGARVYNMSIGGNFSPSGNGQVPSVYTSLLNTFEAELSSIRKGGGIVVVAAGNYGPKDQTGSYGYKSMEQYYSYPAVSDYVVSVAALHDGGGSPYPDGRYSFYGESLDLSAPGSGITGAGNSNDTGTVTQDGTSMATPYVSAFAADLLLQQPDATASTIVYELEHTYSKDITAGYASSGWDKYSGYGMPQWRSDAQLPQQVPDSTTAKPSSGSSSSSTSGSSSSSTSGSSQQSATPSTPSLPAATPTVSLYRLYNPTTGEHLYTIHKEEVDHLVKPENGGWRLESDQTLSVPATSNKPVWRLYHPATGDHHYTMDAYEAKVITSEQGWRYDFSGQPAFYSSESQSKPVWRIYNTRAARFGHLFTCDANERSHWLAAGGWNDEGIGWYAQ